VCDLACGKSCSDCEQQFCVNHIYSCADCGNQYCGDCLDAHRADGHWSDSDTTFELASARRVVRALSINPLDLRHPARTTTNQHRQSSSAIAATLKSLFSFLFQRHTFLSTLPGLTFQNAALLSEVGL
jgi:hypothetical protein